MHFYGASVSSMYSVKVSGIKLRFASAHMATINNKLEPLHGHNYIVSCTLDGSLSPDDWVIDFSEIKKIVEFNCKILDHKFILQHKSKILKIDDDNESWNVSYNSLKYVFPKIDVVALPISNSTAENIAKWFFDKISKDINRSNIENISIEVEEMPGQSGVYSSLIN